MVQVYWKLKPLAKTEKGNLKFITAPWDRNGSILECARDFLKCLELEMLEVAVLFRRLVKNGKVVNKKSIRNLVENTKKACRSMPNVV